MWKKLILLCFCSLIYGFQGFCQPDGVIFVKRDRIPARVVWSRVENPDLSHYVVSIGSETRNYVDTYITTDTTALLFVPKAWETDSVFVAVQAADSAGHVSDYSDEVAFIPAVLKMDFHFDKKYIIDIEDRDKFLKLFRLYVGKTTWKKTQEANK